MIVRVFIVFLNLLYATTVYSISNTNNNTINTLNEHLEADFKLLKAEHCTKGVLKSVTLDEFILLFYEGVNECLSFLSTFNCNRSLYKRRAKVLRKQFKKGKSKHPIFPKLNRRSIRKAFNSGSKECSESFDTFKGKWFGHWQSMLVEHYWLPTTLLNTPVKVRNYTANIEAYQTAFVGDGFGWNYQIRINKYSYILGFVCHLNSEGDVYMKRPHIGIQHHQNSMLWLTKDHVYYEFVCNTKAHKNLPKHYVISGGLFNDRLKHKKLTQLFQDVYFDKLFAVNTKH